MLALSLLIAYIFVDALLRSAGMPVVVPTLLTLAGWGIWQGIAEQRAGLFIIALLMGVWYADGASIPGAASAIFFSGIASLALGARMFIAPGSIRNILVLLCCAGAAQATVALTIDHHTLAWSGCAICGTLIGVMLVTNCVVR